MKSVVMSILVSLVSAGMISAGYGDECERQTFTVTFDLGAFGYAYGPLSQEVEYGESATAPEFFCDPSYDFVEWNEDFSYVTSDMTVHAVYELSSVGKMMDKYSGGYGSDDAFVLDCVCYDVDSHCIRVQGTLDYSYNYSMFSYIDNPSTGSEDSEHDGNLRMRIFCVDRQGNESDVICDTTAWSCSLPVDINEVNYVGIELVSTWYSGEYCWFCMDASNIEHVRFNLLKLDTAEFDPSEYTYRRSFDLGSYYEKGEYHYFRQYEYYRVIEGVKPRALVEIVNASSMNISINGNWYILKSSPLEPRNNVIDYDKAETKIVSTITHDNVRHPTYYHNSLLYSTYIVVDPEQYTVRFDLCGHGERIGGGELIQSVDCLKGEAEVLPKVCPNPHYVFRKWTRSHWDGNTLVYVAEYDREYVIAYEDTKGVYNPNPTNYMVMVTNEIVFVALPDTDEYWFKGWEPAKIEVGTTGDLVVTAKWDRIQGVAEAVGDQNREWVSSGDADWFVTWNDEKGKYVVRSGEIDNCQTSVLETVVMNGGTVSFAVATSCEPSYRGKIRTDGLSFLVDGNEVLWLDGESGWTNVLWSVTGDGTHRLQWKYGKDIEGASGRDCAFLSEFTFYHEVVVSFSGGDATEGDVPRPIFSYNGAEITLPPLGTLWNPRHAFVGWSDGETVYQPGDRFLLGDVAPVFTAQWVAKRLSAPVISVPPFYTTEKTTVTISAEAGAEVRYTLDGSDPTMASAAYAGPFEIAGSMTVKAAAFREDWFDSPVVSATTVRAPWTYGECLNSETLNFASEGAGAWVRDLSVTHDGIAALCSGAIGNNATSRLELVVVGGGELTFWWRASTEVYRGKPMDSGVLVVDGEDVAEIYGEADWTRKAVVLSGGGLHTVRWEFRKDEEDDPLMVGDDCVWLDEVKWTSFGPSVVNDSGATVTGDAETGFVVEPSKDIENVEISLNGVDPSRVTVKVSVGVKTVAAHGAKVKIVSGGADITEFLNVPAANGSGVVDLTKATVKEEIVKEAMDPAKGAKIVLDAANPSLTTPNTRKGLFYQLREGETLGGMKDGDNKVGDGQPWSPEIKVKGGNSAFYSIGVGKGE